MYSTTYVHLQCLIWINRKCSVLSLFTYIVYDPLWIAYSVFTFNIMYICILIKQCMYNICTFKISHKIHQACSVCVTLDINYAPREMAYSVFMVKASSEASRFLNSVLNTP